MSLGNDKGTSCVSPGVCAHTCVLIHAAHSVRLCSVFWALHSSVRVPQSDLGSNADPRVTFNFSDLTLSVCKMGITALLASEVVGRCLEDQVR